MFSIRLTKEERVRVQTFLDRAKALLPTGQYMFKPSEKNKQFDRKYNMTDQQKKDIVRGLCVDDFVEIRPNAVPRYPEAELFIFYKTIEGSSYGEQEPVTLYIKEYILDEDNMEMVVVVSFHEEGLYD